MELHSTVTYRNQQYRSSDKEKPEVKAERLVLQPQALVGSGGMGKSQIAREYAYRYAQEYQTVFWLRASSSELLLTDFADLATRLNLAGKAENDPLMRIEAVKEWLMHFTRWLLVFDDAKELYIIRDFLPRQCFGHIIITTQSSVTGDLAKPIKVEKMPIRESAIFLLRQSKEIGPETVNTQVPKEKLLPARHIAKLLGGLPLMLAQAAAFIERNPGSLRIYADLFQQQPREHLRYRDQLQEYPHPITKTFSLNFDKVSEVSPVAADLLRLFAFLEPSAIPKELITRAALKLGPVLSSLAENPEAIRWAIMELTNYSLVEQSAQENIYTIHPIVQLLIRDMMEEEERQVWAERAVYTAVYWIADLINDSKTPLIGAAQEDAHRRFQHFSPLLFLSLQYMMGLETRIREFFKELMWGGLFSDEEFIGYIGNRAKEVQINDLIKEITPNFEAIDKEVFSRMLYSMIGRMYTIYKNRLKSFSEKHLDSNSVSPIYYFGTHIEEEAPIIIEAMRETFIAAMDDIAAMLEETWDNDMQENVINRVNMFIPQIGNLPAQRNSDFEAIKDALLDEIVRKLISLTSANSDTPDEGGSTISSEEDQ